MKITDERIVVEVTDAEPQIKAINVFADCIKEAIKSNPDKYSELNGIEASIRNLEVKEDFVVTVMVNVDVALYLTFATTASSIAFKEIVIPLIQKKLKIKEYNK